MIRAHVAPGTHADVWNGESAGSHGGHAGEILIEASWEGARIQRVMSKARMIAIAEKTSIKDVDGGIMSFVAKVGCVEFR